MSRPVILRVAALACAAGLLFAPWHGRGDRSPAVTAQDKPTLKEMFPAFQGPAGLPMTGTAVKGLASLDEGVEKIMLRHGIPGAALAITRNGKLVAARGYGWSHHEKNVVATPETLFGLASVSKTFTTLAILKLVEEGKLTLDQKAFALLKHIKPPPRTVVDPRLASITIRQLLNHSGGWDREKSGDPINWAQRVSLALGVRMPISEDHLVRFMLAVPLDFDPGTKQVYSNIGFIILGQIVAQVSGKTYEQYVRTTILDPMGLKGARLHDREGRYFPNEARRYNAGHLQALPAYNCPWTDASGGWAASAIDLARLITAIDGSRTSKPFLGGDMMKEMFAEPPAPLKPRDDKTHYGLGWDSVQKFAKDHGYVKGGSWPGVRSSIKHRVDGFNTILLFNALIQPDPVDMKIAQDAAREIHDHLADLKDWPDVDLFKE